ncbi:efflux RND transporter periplasmic adaptor subunit [Arenibacter algicola]|uniref:efflux RND transporter periplasmic adaptor subunit n=1 Tax=Arenibacter algicola TaxID=616991 RepID=UPI001C074DB9|nr:efflux RND transporter periplasmic adaptor subunit [Arenibacter algicola]MBU2903439.1 efflux RND transporter periplasmic adaptor subunit [Arenibacter algicola]
MRLKKAIYLIRLINYSKYRIAYLNLYFIFFICFPGCKENKIEEAAAIGKVLYTPQKNEVGVQVLKNQPFKEELLANGKLVALQKNVLKFEVGGALEKLYVKNGDYVRKGQILASLQKFTYQQQLDKSEMALKKGELEFRDMLVGRGYDLDLRGDIPDNIYEMAAIRSGYQEAEHQLKDARFELNSATLFAPFDGNVAGIQFKVHEQINSGTEFMTLINDSVFEVEFYLIESEINKIKVNEVVEVLAFSSNKKYEGRISSINPLVEKNGTVLVKAKLKNDGELIEGMNVKVRIQKEVPDQLVVPKSAVILRQNQEVLFKYQKGRTFWTYVNTTNENSTDYSIVPDPEKSSATLVEGDTIIISGNLNLAHDTEVVIKN